MGVLDWFTKARPVRRPTDEPRNPYTTFGGSTIPTTSYEAYVAASAAMYHPVVFRCLNKIAQSVQTTGWYAEPDPAVNQSERAPATTIKRLNDLLASPNDNLASDQLRYWLALVYACYGRVPFKVGKSTEGYPNGIYPLDAAIVNGIINNRGVIDQYKYGLGQTSETHPTKRKASTSQAFIHEIFTPSLTGTLETGKNVTALAAIGLPTQVIRLLLQRAIDTASGHPNNKYIITAEKTLSAKQKEAIKEHIEESAAGGEESGNILFLNNTKVEVHKLDNDLSDIHSKMPMDDMSRMIAGAFGIPIALIGLGAADGAKFAGNYIESRLSFWEDTIIPGYLSPIATGLTAALCPYGARIVFDHDTIPALADSRIKRAKELAAVTHLTVDEKRELSGFPPLKSDQILDRPAPVATSETKVD